MEADGLVYFKAVMST